ncbi:MAG: TolC family protein [Pseudomonadota bacterium]|nr:TolC family protein [Pseudomonadota bacterium]
MVLLLVLRLLPTCLIFLTAQTLASTGNATDKIALDELLRSALKSAQAQQLILQAQTFNLDRSQARYDGRLETKMDISHSVAESPSSNLQIDKIAKKNLQVKYLKNIRSGTQLQVEWALDHQDMEFVAALDNQVGFQSQGALTVKQSLWRNAFGRAWQAEEQALILTDKASKESLQANLEALAMVIVKQYYQAWLLQVQLQATYQHIKLQKRLLRVSKVKFDLGTADKADILQIRASLAGLQQRVKDSLNSLRMVWAQLVTAINLPVVYVNTDISGMRLTLDKDYQASQASCAELRNKNRAQLQSASLRSFKHSLQALEHQIAQHKDSLKPEVFAALRVANNGIDTSFASSVWQSVADWNVSASVSIGLNIELGKHRQYANLAESLKQKQITTLSIDQAQTELQVEILNACNDFARLISKEQTFQKIYQQQRQRIALQEERFRIGQIDVLQIVQASNDLIEAELRLKETAQELGLTVWKIRKADGSLFRMLRD